MRLLQVSACEFSPDGTLVATCSDVTTLCIIDIATEKKVYTVQSDACVRAQPISFVLTIVLAVWCRVVARRDASCCSDKGWQCYPSHHQQCALDSAQHQHASMHHACRSFFAHPLSSCMDARSVQVGSLPSVETMKQ